MLRKLHDAAYIIAKWATNRTRKAQATAKPKAKALTAAQRLRFREAVATRNGAEIDRFLTELACVQPVDEE